MLEYSYYYTIKQFEKMGLKVGYKIRGKKTGFTIQDNKGKVLYTLYDRYRLEEKMLELKHDIKHKKRRNDKMIKYLIELNEDMENGLTIEELETIENMSIEEIENIYNNVHTSNDYLAMESDYIQLLELVLTQLQRNQPLLTGLFELKEELSTELEKAENDEDIENIGYYEELENIVYIDSLLIENLFYEELMYYIPIKYYTNNIALRTEMNDFMDRLNKNGRIEDFTVENIDYSITPTDINNIQ